jgi:hypothetical protein
MATTYAITNDAQALAALESIMSYCQAQAEQIPYHFGTIDDAWVGFRRYSDASNKLFSTQHLLAGERDEAIREELERELKNIAAHQELTRLHGMKNPTYTSTIDWVKTLEEQRRREYFREEQGQLQHSVYEKLCERTGIHDMPFNPDIDYVTVLFDCLEMPAKKRQNQEIVMAQMYGEEKRAQS